MLQMPAGTKRVMGLATIQPATDTAQAAATQEDEDNDSVLDDDLRLALEQAKALN